MKTIFTVSYSDIAENIATDHIQFAAQFSADQVIMQKNKDKTYDIVIRFDDEVMADAYRGTVKEFVKGGKAEVDVISKVLEVISKGFEAFGHYSSVYDVITAIQKNKQDIPEEDDDANSFSKALEALQSLVSKANS